MDLSVLHSITHNHMLHLLNKYWFLLVLIIVFSVPRILWIADGNIVFTFDQGKDSLAVLHMWLTQSPKLIGPWTSIPGLFFGPGWYYLLLPAYVLGSASPFGAVWIMVVLGVAQIVLSYRYFGKYMALIVATTQMWMTVSQSAWNPFPMPFITLLILIVLQNTANDRKITRTRAALLGLLVGFGFHFSTAFAIFYPLLLTFFLLMRKIRPSLVSLMVFGMALCIPFMPQLAFELRHDFLQTHAVMRYITEPSINKGNDVKEILPVVQSVLKEITLAALPTFEGTYYGFIYFVPFFTVLVYVITFSRLYKKGSKDTLFSDALFWFFIPTIGFLFLHYNTWYTLGMLPLFALLSARLLEASPQYLKVCICILFLLTPLERVYRYYTVNRTLFYESRGFLPAKRKALAYIRAQAHGEPFASYHYVPDVYDYSYQYLYFWHAYNGLPLPTEFSYKPNESAYVPEKQEIMQYFGQSSGKPVKIFFIVEKPEREELLEQWWTQQRYGKIVSKQSISNEITVFEATPVAENVPQANQRP